MPREKANPFERLALYIEETETGCTRWTGAKDQDGYAMFWYEGRTMHATRALWNLCYGEIPIGYVIRHKCDNPECMELSHLELGLPKDNTADAKVRNRLIGPRKVNKELADKINDLRKAGSSLKQIAAITGLSVSSLYSYFSVDVKRKGDYAKGGEHWKSSKGKEM